MQTPLPQPKTPSRRHRERYPFLPEKRVVTVISVAMPNLNEKVNKCPVYAGPADQSARHSGPPTGWYTVALGVGQDVSAFRSVEDIL